MLFTVNKLEHDLEEIHQWHIPNKDVGFLDTETDSRNKCTHIVFYNYKEKLNLPGTGTTFLTNSVIFNISKIANLY